MTARPTPTQREADFQTEDIFFTRTDPKGAILSASHTFKRMSRAEWDQILNTPHNIIRHPDMPKGVFYDMWNKISAGNPYAAFLKNMDADGAHFWTLAIVAPSRHGFLSVQFKPRGESFEKAKSLYAELRTKEREEKLSPEDCAKALQNALADIGYPNYDSFIAQALNEEFTLRQTAAHGRDDTELTDLMVKMKSLHEIAEEADRILTSFARIHETPLNMGIQAAKLGEQAGPLSVIASNYGGLAKTIRERIEGLLENTQSLLAVVEEGSFLRCASHIQEEAIRVFQGEEDLPESIDKDDDVALLTSLYQLFEERADTATHTVSLKAKSFVHVSQDLKRVLSGLALTRVFCQIETAHVGDQEGSLGEIIGQLENFQKDTATALRIIEASSRRLTTHRRRTQPRAA